MSKIKVLVMFFVLILISSSSLISQAYADTYGMPKEQKQKTAAFFVFGFVVVYGFWIYVDKSERTTLTNKR